MGEGGMKRNKNTVFFKKNFNKTVPSEELESGNFHLKYDTDASEICKEPTKATRKQNSRIHVCSWEEGVTVRW